VIYSEVNECLTDEEDLVGVVRIPFSVTFFCGTTEQTTNYYFLPYGLIFTRTSIRISEEALLLLTICLSVIILLA
jgi:hypothetical protein